MRTSSSGTTFALPDGGVHPARCFKIVDVGTQPGSAKYPKPLPRVWVFFELPSQLMEPDESGNQRPFMVGQRYTLTHTEGSHLRKALESWYGRGFDTKKLDDAGGFDMSKLLGRPALLNIVHSDDDKFANIAAIMPLPDGTAIPDQINPSFMFDLAEFDQKAYDALSERMQTTIASSPEYMALGSVQTDALAQVAAPVDEFEDDIPF